MQGETMNGQPENLSIAEKKMAYVMGYDVDGPCLVERLLTQWRVFMAYRHIHANHVPMQVFLRNTEPEKV